MVPASPAPTMSSQLMPSPPVLGSAVDGAGFSAGWELDWLGVVVLLGAVGAPATVTVPSALWQSVPGHQLEKPNPVLAMNDVLQIGRAHV